jgi:hypothetical protein
MISRIDNDNETRIIRILEFKTHERYDGLSNHFDIALVRLARMVLLSEKIHPICLPTRDYENEKAIVTGFGRTDGASENMSKYLMKATLEKYNDTSCKYYYGQRFDSQTMRCFGNSAKSHVVDSCNVS